MSEGKNDNLAVPQCPDELKEIHSFMKTLIEDKNKTSSAIDNLNKRLDSIEKSEPSDTDCHQLTSVRSEYKRRPIQEVKTNSISHKL